MFWAPEGDDADAGYHVKLHGQRMSFEQLIGASVPAATGRYRLVLDPHNRWDNIKGSLWIR